MKSPTKIVCLILSLLVFGCKEQTKVQVLPQKSNAEIELEKTKKILEESGEQAITDTSIYKRFLYFGHDVLSHSVITCVKDLNDDSLAVVTLMWISNNHLQYTNDSLTRIGEFYDFIGNLKKVSKQIGRKNSSLIFRFFDSIVKEKLLIPIGEEQKRDRSGDIVDGGDWLFYYDGKQFYKYNTYNSHQISPDSIYNLLEKNIDYKLLVQELQRPY